MKADSSRPRQVGFERSNLSFNAQVLDILFLLPQLSEAQKDVLRSSWKVIYSEIGQSLCYVGGTGAESSSGEHPASGSADEERGDDVTKTHEHRGVAETFFRLFEEYPQSRAFFAHLVSLLAFFNGLNQFQYKTGLDRI